MTTLEDDCFILGDMKANLVAVLLQPLSVYDLYYTLGLFVVNVMIYTGHGAVVR